MEDAELRARLEPYFDGMLTDPDQPKEPEPASGPDDDDLPSPDEDAIPDRDTRYDDIIVRRR